MILRKAAKCTSLLLFGIVFALSVLMIWQSASIHDSAVSSLLFCAQTLIPALFPTMLLCDVMMSLASPEMPRCVPKNHFLFHLPLKFTSSMLFGLLFGFPIGAKILLSNENSETYHIADARFAFPFLNNPGSAFLIAGIGGGMLHDTSAGIALFFSLAFSALIPLLVFSLFRPCSVTEDKPETREASSRNFGEMLQTNAIAMISICGCVFFFSMLIALCERFLPSTIVDPIAAVLEIGNSAHRFTEGGMLHSTFGLGFSVGFGGISVAMQSAFYLKQLHLSYFRYLFCKTMQGLLCGTFFVFFSVFF